MGTTECHFFVLEKRTGVTWKDPGHVIVAVVVDCILTLPFIKANKLDTIYVSLKPWLVCGSLSLSQPQIF